MMNQTTTYKRNRSSFFLRINENGDGSYNFFAPQAIRHVLGFHFKEICEASPTGWKNASHNLLNIWVPSDNADQIDIRRIKDWAQLAGNHRVWLGLNKHLQGHFTGNELDYCIAGDFNFIVSDDDKITERSDLGNAEWSLKYHYGTLSEDEREQYCRIMVEALINMIGLLPVRLHKRKFDFGFFTPPIISPIPTQKDSNKLAYAFAKHVAHTQDIAFLEPTLAVEKPKMKQLNIEEKIATWKSIYATHNAVNIDRENIRGKNVIVIDDLYQSGVTMWSYAELLKNIGASRVYGLSCVKSMKDTDNK